ncbi:MAG TPA: aldo/keto reductase [Fimbriimonadaceae bacterium]|nr:aldo/keto reductase [Fimbriimonadaceae bacterium]
MKYGNIAGIDKPVSRLVQGTVMITSERRDESNALLDGIFEAGCNCFDTAHIYGGGDNERTVGDWIRSRGIRDRVVILAKGSHPYEGRNRCTPEDIASDIADSLERFQVEKMDLYILHRDDPSVPVGEIVDALDEHKRAGRIDAYGGSNWTHHRVAAANEHAKNHGRTPFAASSPQFGLAWPQKEVWAGCLTIGGPDGEEARQWYTDHDVALMPWSSLGGGFFSGKFRRDNLGSFTDYFEALCADCFGHEANFERYDRSKILADDLGVTPAQVALAWVVQQPMRPFPLVGCRTAEEFRQNAAALDLTLSPEQLAFLTEGKQS